MTPAPVAGSCSPVVPIFLTPRARARALVSDVCRKHGIAETEALSSRRLPALVKARDEISYRLHAELDMSFPAIGRLLKRRSHVVALQGAHCHQVLIQGGKQ